MRLPRASGILLHPTSLPSRFGIGDLGPEAYRFVDFLTAAGQSFWQIMPLGPSGLGDSPYASTSAFAGNVNVISPEALVTAGFLADADLQDVPEFPAERVDYGGVIGCKRRLLETAFQRFRALTAKDPARRQDYEAALHPESGWLDEYALFAALRDEHGGADWQAWGVPLARREPADLAEARRALADRVEAHRFFQYVFHDQWRRLRRYANDRGVRIIGDIPIFVAHNSADVWSRRELFKLDERGDPIAVAGVPPDAFSATGQLWGNPLYEWDALERERFAWWIARIRHIVRRVDVARLDHFRGFAACWEVEAGAPSAEHGHWVKAPGAALLKAVEDALGDLPIIAEDLGTITPDVHQLRDEFGLPGMRVLQFAWGGDPHDTHLPHEYTRNGVAYTGTHDNDTVVGWFEQRSRPEASAAERRERENCLRYLATDGAEINWDFIRAVQMSVANLAMMPLQDVLGLGTSARMNTPARPEGNWMWRLRSGALTDGLRDRLREMTTRYGRAVAR